jgi:hypothetical protein
VTKTAHLRVYTPESSEDGDPVPGFVRSYCLLSESEGDADWVVEWNGQRMVCPRNLRLRVLESTVAFANAFRGLGAGLIPEEAARAADSELRRYHQEHPGHRSHVLTSAWHVPVRWFTAFQPEDKDVYEVEGTPRIRLRVDLAVGRKRVDHALGVLRGLQVFQGPAEELAQLSEWIDSFPGESMLELDRIIEHQLLRGEQVGNGRVVELLADGDMMTAGENYGRVVSRWAPAFSVTFCS